jgi:hypothetical protein
VACPHSAAPNDNGTGGDDLQHYMNGHVMRDVSLTCTETGILA